MIVSVASVKVAVSALHHNFHSQANYIAKGQFEISSDGKSSIISAGDPFFMTPNLVNGAKCMEAGVFIHLCISK